MKNYLSFSLFASTQDRAGFQKLLRYASQMLVKLESLRKLDLHCTWHVILYHDGRLPTAFFDAASRLANENFTEVYVGCSNGMDGMFWRFLVHDRPDTGVYYVTDADEMLQKADIECMNALTGDETLEAAVCIPHWRHPVCDREGIETLLVDGGGFGMRPSKVSFHMQPLILNFQRNHDYTEQYGMDEVFLTKVIEPIMSRTYRIKRRNFSSAIPTHRYSKYRQELNKRRPVSSTTTQLHVFRGSCAFDKDTLMWLRNSDEMGYGFWPVSNKIIRGVQHVVDNEVSLNNTNAHMRVQLLKHIWHGPWMKEIRRLLPDPQLMSVEIHVNGNTTNGKIHRDHSHPFWIVVVPLSEEGNHSSGCGGTTVVDDETDERISVSCECNDFFIFPGHFRHFREASVSKEFAQKRRTMFIIFTDMYKLPAEFMSTGRQLHAKAKGEGRTKRRAETPFRMTLRQRK